MNLKEIAKSRGTNLKKVAEKCGVPASTLYAISSGDTNYENVGIGLFMKIAKALDMTTEELYEMESHVEYAVVELKDELTVDEMELLDYYRYLDDDEKKQVLSIADGLHAIKIFKNGGHKSAHEHGFDFVECEPNENIGRWMKKVESNG